jgi:hypothetical protein
LLHDSLITSIELAAMVNNDKNKNALKLNLNSLASQIDFQAYLDQHQIQLKTCTDGQFLQVIHIPTGLSITIPNNQIENIGYKRYMLQKLMDKIEAKQSYKTRFEN